MKLKLILLTLLLVWPLSTLAIEAQTNDYVNLASDQVVNGNYYAAGSRVEILGTVNGDVFVAGSDIVIDSENINGDIFAAGNSISIKGKVNGSLRLVGQKLVVNGEVARNILAAGQYLDLNKDSKVYGHVSFVGQMAGVYGWVGGRFESALENLRLSGQIVGDSEVYLGNNKTANIDLLNGANIQGHLKYWSDQNLNLDQAKVSQGIEHQQISEIVKNKIKPQLSLFGLLWQILSMLVVALLWWRWKNKFFYQSYDIVKKNPGKSLLVGFLSLLAIPVLFILLMLTVIGIPLALIFLVTCFVTLYLTKILAAWLLVCFVQQTWWKKYQGKDWALLIAGIVVMSLLVKLPIIGWVISLIFYLWAWGAIFYYFYNQKSN